MSPRARTWALAGLALAGLARPEAPGVAAEVPYLSGRVNDTADLLDAAVEERIEHRLAALEAASGAQIAVLTIVSLDGEPVEDFALRVAETWGLGRAGSDDGILFLIARDDRRMRIEVGYGLEPELTDAQAGRILRNVVTPRFQGGDFSGGVEAGVEAIVGTLEGSRELPRGVERGQGGSSNEGLAPINVVSLFLLALFTFPALLLRGLGGWFLFLFLLPVWGTLASHLFGPGAVTWVLVAWVVLFLLAKLLLATPAGKRWTASRHGGWGSWGTGSGSSGRGWTGGGFSGGGFSGGGGGFGGGGASGSW